MMKLGRKQLPWILVLLLAGALPTAAQMTRAPRVEVLPPGLGRVNIEQHLGQQVPLDLLFRDESGRTVALGQYFNNGKPVILNLVYLNCPVMCSEVMNSLTGSLRVLNFDLGAQFNVLTVSFDPRENPALAATKKKEYLARYGRPGAEVGWHFLTGDSSSVTALTDVVGFHYQWDPKTQQFAHATGIIILTPQGRIAQYYYGAEYSPRDLRLGLIQASQSRIGTLADRVLLYCYRYDPRVGRYGAMVTRIVQVAGGATVILLGGLLLFLFRSDPQQRRTNAVSEHQPGRSG
ncbi:MAG: SCO family protein [Terriglobales bacterium]